MKKPKKLSYDWWWRLGYLHCSRNSLEPKPKYHKVQPYLDGWFEKYDEAQEWGDRDFINE
jgi:hypothetical protein